MFLFAERFFFIFALCIPFEIRDMAQEHRWGNITLPMVVGIRQSKFIGLLVLLLFIFLVYIHSSYMESITGLKNYFDIPLYISAVITAFLIWFSKPTGSKYYFRLFVDGSMQLQFLLVLLFNCFR